MTAVPAVYPRPTVTQEQVQTAIAAAQKHRHEPTSKMVNVIAALILENMRLVAEVNDHRAARGFVLLETHEV